MKEFSGLILLPIIYNLPFCQPATTSTAGLLRTIVYFSFHAIFGRAIFCARYFAVEKWFKSAFSSSGNNLNQCICNVHQYTWLHLNFFAYVINIYERTPSTQSGNRRTSLPPYKLDAQRRRRRRITQIGAWTLVQTVVRADTIPPHAMKCGSGIVSSKIGEKWRNVCGRKDKRSALITSYYIRITCWMHNALQIANFRIKWLFILCPRHSVFVLLLLLLTTLWNQLTGSVSDTEQLFCSLYSVYS